MKSWHLIVDVARCHDCNDCFLADKDEFVDNEFPPYSAAQPWHGHRWMNIKRKERGQYPLVRDRVPADAVHALRRGAVPHRRRRRLQAPRRPRHHRPGQGQGPQGDRRQLPLLGHLLERGEGAGAEVHRLRPPARRRLDRDALQPGVPDRGDQARARRGGRRGAHGRGRGPRALPRLPRHQAARLLQEPAPLGEGVRRLQRRVRRHRRVRRGRHGDRAARRQPSPATARPTSSARSPSTSSRRATSTWSASRPTATSPPS